MNKGMFSALLGVAAIIILSSTALISSTKLDLTESEAFAQSSINKVNTVWQNNYFEIMKINEEKYCNEIIGEINSFLDFSKNRTGIDCESKTTTSITSNTVTVELICFKNSNKNSVELKKEFAFNCTVPPIEP
jgi:hypothetical protein